MTVSKDRKPKLSSRGAAKLFETQALTMPADQIYRELTKNALEACAKMKAIDPNFKGEIIITEDENHPEKFSIIDNGIGMRTDRITSLIVDLAETEEQSEDGNFGCGTKVAGFANNRKGIVYTSLHHEEDEGSRCQVYFNRESIYAVRHIDQIDGEYINDCRVSLEVDEMPELIQRYRHGTQVTLFGNSENENTLRPPANYAEASMLKASRKDSVHWLMACINTKFFTIPDYVTIRVQIKRKDRTSYEIAHGHKYYLDNYSDNRGVFESPTAKFHWWVLMNDAQGISNRKSRNECVVLGHLAYMHKKELVRIDFNRKGMKCPLKDWHLNFAYQHVALIIEPKEFEPNSQRTSLYKNKVEYTDYILQWRDYFIEHMPEPIRKLEAELQAKHAEKIQDNDLLAKKAADYLKTLTIESTKGKEFTDEAAKISGGMKKPSGGDSENKIDTDGTVPGPSFGQDPLIAGLKSKSGKKARRTKPNPFPEFKVRNDMELDEWVDYNYNDHKVWLNANCPLIEEYSKKAAAKSKGFALENVKGFTRKVFADQLSMKIAMTRFRDETGFSEEDKKEALNNKALTMVLLDITLIDKIVDNFKHLDKKSKEIDDFIKENEVEQTIPVSGIQ